MTRSPMAMTEEMRVWKVALRPRPLQEWARYAPLSAGNAGRGAYDTLVARNSKEEVKMMSKGEVRFNKYGPIDAYLNILHSAAVAALERGLEQYGETWQEHLREDETVLWNAQHTIEVHAQTRILEALEYLDYGDIDGFVAKLGSAVGYLATAVCKAFFLIEVCGY